MKPGTVSHPHSRWLLPCSISQNTLEKLRSLQLPPINTVCCVLLQGHHVIKKLYWDKDGNLKEGEALLQVGNPMQECTVNEILCNASKVNWTSISRLKNVF